MHLHQSRQHNRPGNAHIIDRMQHNVYLLHRAGVLRRRKIIAAVRSDSCLQCLYALRCRPIPCMRHTGAMFHPTHGVICSRSLCRRAHQRTPDIAGHRERLNDRQQQQQHRPCDPTAHTRYSIDSHPESANPDASQCLTKSPRASVCPRPQLVHHPRNSSSCNESRSNQIPQPFFSQTMTRP